MFHFLRNCQPSFLKKYFIKYLQLMFVVSLVIHSSVLKWHPWFIFHVLISSVVPLALSLTLWHPVSVVWAQMAWPGLPVQPPSLCLFMLVLMGVPLARVPVEVYSLYVFKNFINCMANELVFGTALGWIHGLSWSKASSDWCSQFFKNGGSFMYLLGARGTFYMF